MTLKCGNCKSTAIRKTALGKYLCSICLHVTKESNVYTEEFKVIKFTRQIKLDTSAFQPETKKNRHHVKLSNHLQKNWTIYLLTLQDEIRLVSKRLSKYYKNRSISKIMKILWFDLISRSKKKQQMITLKFTAKHVMNEMSCSKYTPMKRIESTVLRDLEKANSKYSTKKINYDFIFGNKFSLKPNLDNLALKNRKFSQEQENEEKKEEHGSYKYNSRRFLRSKKLKRVEKSGKMMRRRRKSSNIKLVQDDETISMFKDLEENLLNCKGEREFFSKILILVQEKCESVRIEFLVKRYAETYIFGSGKKLNKNERVSLKLEVKKVIFYVNKMLEIEKKTKILLLDYASLKVDFHFLCFVLGLMKHICDFCNEKFKNDVGLENTFYPFQVLDIEIFIDKIPWEKFKKMMKLSFEKIKKFCEKVEEKSEEKKGWHQTLGSTISSTFDFGDKLTISNSIFQTENQQEAFFNLKKNLDLEFEEENNFTLDLSKSEKNSDFITYEKLVAMIHLSLILSKSPFCLNEIEILIKGMKREKFNTNINHNFLNRRNYLFYNLRYFRRLKPNKLWKDFKILYPCSEDWKTSDLFKNQKKFNFEVKFEEKIITVEGSSEIFLKKIMDDFGFCDELKKISLTIVEMIKEEKKLKLKKKELVIGIIFFTLKLFYGLGIGVASMINLKHHMIEKFIKKPSLKTKVLKCISYINLNAENSKNKGKKSLVDFSHKLAPFQNLVESWISYHDKCLDSRTIYDNFTQISQANLENFKRFVKNFLEEILKQKCKIDSREIVTVINDFGSYDKKKKVRYFKGKKVEVNVKKNLVDFEFVQNQELREEIKEEVEFINENFGDKEVEIPHPSDIFIKFKMFGSIPFEKVGEDFLILVKFFGSYLDFEEEKIIQVAQKTERNILKCLRRNNKVNKN